MAKLKTIYDKADDIPEGFAELYTERNGKFELSGVEGIKTQGDVDRINEALRKEKADHKAVKDKLVAFGEIDPATIPAALEELAEAKARLETIGKDGKLDETKIEERINAAVTRAVGPLQRDKTNLERQIQAKDKIVLDKDGEIGALKGSMLQSAIETKIRDDAVAAKVIPYALDDAVLVGARAFERLEDGRIVTKDAAGVTPGLTPAEWLKDMQEKRPHWWPPSQGGGAQGGRGGAPGVGADNPWSVAGWNVTKQGQMVTQHGAAKAAEMAKAVNSVIGATKPTPLAKAA